MATADHILTLSISLAGCRNDVRVNDVPIFRDIADGWPLTSSRSVNEYLRPGINRISVALWPGDGHDRILPSHDPLTVGLSARGPELPKTADRRIVSVDLLAGKGAAQPARLNDGDNAVGTVTGAPTIIANTATSFRARFEVMLPGAAHRWKWLDSDVIPATPPTLAALTDLYRHIHAMLGAGRTDWIASTMAERTHDMALALFEPRAVLEAGNGLYDATRGTTLRLLDLDLDTARMDVFGDGKLAQLARWDGLPLIVFVTDDGIAEYYPLTFRYQGEWLLCR